jgi:hypothetical protein
LLPFPEAGAFARFAWIGCSEGGPEITITYQDATFSPIIIGSGSFFMTSINA